MLMLRGSILLRSLFSNAQFNGDTRVLTVPWHGCCGGCTLTAIWAFVVYTIDCPNEFLSWQRMAQGWAAGKASFPLAWLEICI